MLETTPPLEGKEISAAAALTKTKQKIKTYAKFFLVVMSLFACTPSPLCHFLSLILGTPPTPPPPPPPPYLSDVIFEWPQSDLY